MKKNISGQSLFEVILALGLIALVITAVVAVAGISIKNTSFSKNQTLGSRLAESTIEWLRGQRDENWETFADRALTSVWCLPELSWDSADSGNCGTDSLVEDTNLKREIEFLEVSSTDIQTTVKVYWQDGSGYHEVSTVTSFTDQR